VEREWSNNLKGSAPDNLLITKGQSGFTIEKAGGCQTHCHHKPSPETVSGHNPQNEDIIRLVVLKLWYEAEVPGELKKSHGG
jgi:hypothetical protein